MAGSMATHGSCDAALSAQQFHVAKLELPAAISPIIL
jgi:hypothetical protein